MARPGINSMRVMRGTGFMKCMPMNCSGRDVAAAKRVIEIELVLVARMVWGGARRSASLKIEVLRDSISGTASITKSAYATACKDKNRVLKYIRFHLKMKCNSSGGDGAVIFFQR